MKRKSKICLLILSGLLILSLALYTAGYFLNQQAKQFVVNLAEELSLEIGHTVTLSKVSSKWDWLYFKVKVDDLVVVNKDTNLTFFKVGQIVATVDTLNSLVNLELQFKHLQFVSPHLILQLDGQQDSSLMLKLLATQRSVSIKHGELHIQGWQGTDLPLTDLKVDFKKKSASEYFLAVRGEIAAETPPEFNFAMNYYGELETYTGATIDFELKTSNIQAEQLFNLFPQYQQQAIVGRFKDFDLKGSIQNGELIYINNNFAIDRINFGNNTLITNGEGRIEFRPQKHKTNLSLLNLQIDNSQQFSKPLTIDSVIGEIHHQDNEISSNHLKIKACGMDFYPKIQATINNNKIENLAVRTRVTGGHVTRLGNLLPDKGAATAISTWLKKSLIDGAVNAAALHYQPDKIYWQVDFKQAEIKYSAAWPSIAGVEASLILDDTNLSIVAHKAHTLGHKLNLLSAKFLPVQDKPHGLLLINGNIDTSLQSCIDYLKLTPLQKKIADKLSAFNPQGPINLDLNLSINLSDENYKISTDGKLQLQNDSIYLAKIGLPLTEITGDINFTQDSLSAKDINLQLLGSPAVAKLALNTQVDTSLNITLATPLSAANLQQLFPKVDLARISGATDITASLDIPWGSANMAETLTIRSDLLGLGIDLPAPFNKIAASKVPLQLKYITQAQIDPVAYLKFPDMWLKYEVGANNITLDSSLIKGKVHFTEDADTFEVKLDYLDLSAAQSKDNSLTNLIKDKHKNKKLPMIQFYAENLKLKNKQYKKFNLQLLPRTYGYEITDFSLQQDNISLQTQGQWQLDNKEYTSLSGNAYIKDFGRGLHDWGYGNSITKGNGELNFALRWDGAPKDFNLLKLDGTAHLDLRSGTITEAKPGLGRILGLLSLESIQRRLQLDFSDLFGKGLAFDKITSDMKIQAGTLASDNIKINSPSARIELAGKSDLHTQGLDFTMFVMPKVGVGLPVAAAIAVGNPAIGAALWLFDQAAGAKISEITKYKYKVAGTWSAPQIDEILSKK